MMNDSPPFQSQNNLNVLLVDDHSLVAELLSKYLPLEGEFSVTVSHSRDDALEKISSQGTFDVLLLDVLLPERLTIDDVRQFVNLNSGGKVILFSGNVSENFVNESLSAGSFGFIPKTISLRSLASTINLVASGEAFIPAGYFKKTDDQAADNMFNLTKGEFEVLVKLGHGCSNKEIMSTLDLPESTVKMRVRTLSRKLGAKNRTHAVIIARENSLI